MGRLFACNAEGPPIRLGLLRLPLPLLLPSACMGCIYQAVSGCPPRCMRRRNHKKRLGLPGRGCMTAGSQIVRDTGRSSVACRQRQDGFKAKGILRHWQAWITVFMHCQPEAHPRFAHNLFIGDLFPGGPQGLRYTGAIRTVCPMSSFQHRNTGYNIARILQWEFLRNLFSLNPPKYPEPFSQ